MFILKKLFSLRQTDDDDGEKPFLEHLDDLRVTITKIVATLLIGTIVAWVFREALMDVIRRPIDQVWETQQAASLPQALTPTEWEDAKLNALALSGLGEKDRGAFLDALDEKTAGQASVLTYYRAVLRLPEETREQFVANLEKSDESTLAQITALIERNPDASLDASQKVKLMGAFKPTEAFMLSMKLAFFAAVVVTFPLLLLFILEFIIPGLKDNERKILWPALSTGFGLFLIGVLFCYFFVLPNVLDFFFTFGQEMRIENDWRIGYYITFATRLTLIFGLAFELPVVVMTMVKLGLLDAEMMRNTRSYAILAIFITAALITPTPDAPTMLLLAVPMYLLYEMCIWLSTWLEARERKREEAEDKERLAELMAKSSAAAASTAENPAPAPTPEEIEEEERLAKLLAPPEESIGSDDPYAIANDSDDEHLNEMDDGIIDDDLLVGLDNDDDDPEDEIPEEEKDRK